MGKSVSAICHSGNCAAIPSFSYSSSGRFSTFLPQLVRLMTSKIIALGLAICFVSFSITSAANNNAFLRAGDAQKAGLEVMWTSQIALDAARTHVRDVIQVVGPVTFTYAWELGYAEATKETYSQFDRDRFGNIIGVVGAEEKANKRKAQLEELGYKVEIKKIDTKVDPKVICLVLTSSSLIHAIDAETGETKWTTQVGNRLTPCYVGASFNHIAVVNGSRISCLDSKNGKILWTRKVRGAASGSPAVAKDFIFVPMFDGRVEDFSIYYPKRSTRAMSSNGRIFGDVIESGGVIGWTTDNGFLNFAEAGEVTGGRAVRSRIQAEGTMRTPPRASHRSLKAAKRNTVQFFVGSSDGVIHSVDGYNGRLVWQFPIGEEMNQPIRPFGDDVFAVSEESTLYNIDRDSGLQKWKTENVNRIIGATKTKLLVSDMAGNLRSMDRKTGGLVATLQTKDFEILAENNLTDRLLIGTKSGVLQCLKEIGADKPMFHIPINTKKVQLQAKKEESGRVKEPGAAEEDPFGGFGGGDAGGEVDPFGDLGGDAKEEEDPFGAMDEKGEEEEDPFGDG